MNRKIVVAAVCVLSLMVMLLGCVGGAPSSGNAKEAVLRSAESRSIYHWVREVEVIDIGRPYTVRSLLGDYTYWPAKVYLIGGERRHEVRVEVYKDEFGEWRAVLPLSLR